MAATVRGFEYDAFPDDAFEALPDIPADADDDDGAVEDAGEKVTWSPDTVVDKFGDYSLVPDDEEASEWGYGAGGVTGEAMQAVVTRAGVRNGSFRQGPPDPTQAISDTNPLPYWRWVGVDGVEAFWVEDADAPSGHTVRITVRDGVPTAQTYYLEQVVPAAAADIVRLASSRWSSGTLMSAAAYRWNTWAQCLDIDGNTTGDEYEAVQDFITRRRRAPFQLATDAAYVRLRVGGETIDAVTFAGTGDLYEASVSTPFLAWLTLSGEADSLPATGSAIVPLVGTVNGAARRWQGGTLVWVVHVHARTEPAVSISGGGRLAVNVYDASASTALSPTAYLPNGNSDGYSYEPFATTAVVSDIVNILRFQTSITTGTNSTTTAHVYCTALCAVVIDSTEADYS